MPQELDLSTLSVMDALDLAALIEEEARERYEEFVAQMEQHHLPDAAAFFRFMAENEAKHGHELEARRRSMFGAAPRRVTRAMLWDEEAPGYETVSPVLTQREAMEVALDAELKAQSFFARALMHVDDPGVQELFKSLRDEEVEHGRLVEHALAKLPPEDGTRAEEWADEPIAL